MEGRDRDRDRNVEVNIRFFFLKRIDTDKLQQWTPFGQQGI